MASNFGRLPRPTLEKLVLLYEAGCFGILQSDGTIRAGKPPGPLPGTAIEWLRLVARGYIAGEDDRLILTVDGRQEAQNIVTGRIREASP
jgi:hypothetical protein